MLRMPYYMVCCLKPQGFVDASHPDYVCKLVKSLYGLKQASRAWFECFTSHLLSLGFVASHSDTSLFVRNFGDNLTYLLLYVDDIIVTGNQPSYIQQLITQLRSRFDMADLGPLRYFLGLEITRSSLGINVCQTKYVRDLLTRYGMSGVKPCNTPIILRSDVSVGDPCCLEDSQSFRAIVGSLHYLTFTRPDIAFSISKLSQAMHSPCSSHLIAAKCVLRYLAGSMDKGMLFRASQSRPFQLSAFSDSDWAGDQVDRRSTTGFVVFLGHNPISWVAKKQTTVSRSSTEAKYRALAFTATELFWIQQLLSDLHIFGPSPPLLFCDNKSAIQLAKNPVFHGRTKHIEIDFHFIRECVVSKDISLHFVATEGQLVDILTKSLTAGRLAYLRDKLMT